MDFTKDQVTNLSVKMKQMRIDYNDRAESNKEDVVLTSRKRVRLSNREIERPRKTRKEKFLTFQESHIVNDTTSCQTRHCEYLRPEKLIRNAGDAKHYDNKTLFAGGMKGVTEHRLTRDLTYRPELTMIEGELEIWKHAYSESVKMLDQFLMQKNNLSAELKNTLRSRRHRLETMKRTCVAHVVRNNSQKLSLRETSSEDSRLPTYPALQL